MAAAAAEAAKNDRRESCAMAGDSFRDDFETQVRFRNPSDAKGLGRVLKRTLRTSDFIIFSEFTGYRKPEPPPPSVSPATPPHRLRQAPRHHALRGLGHVVLMLPAGTIKSSVVGTRPAGDGRLVPIVEPVRSDGDGSETAWTLTGNPPQPT